MRTPWRNGGSDGDGADGKPRRGGWRERLGKRGVRALGVWIVVLLVAMPFAARQNQELSGGGFEDLDSQSWKVQEALDRGDYPGTQGMPLAAVFVPREGATARDLHGAIAEVSDATGEVGGIEPEAKGLRTARDTAAARPDRTVVLPLEFEGGIGESINFARDLRKELGIEGSETKTLSDGRVAVHIAGQGALWAAYQQKADTDLRKAESRGFPVIAAVLLAAFGSLAAAALPLGLGVAAVVVTGAIVYGLALQFPMSTFTASMASMVGIGVAVDYSLFILVRYREEVARGRSPVDARAHAMSTSGRAVIFSGATVFLSLAALFLINSTGIRSMAVGAMIVVAVAVLASATLLPILITLLGDRAHEPGRLGRWWARRRERRQKPPEEGFWVRWAGAVQRRPVLSLLAATALMVTLASPIHDLVVRNSASRQLPASHETREGMKAVSDLSGPGSAAPAYVEVSFDGGNASSPDARETLAKLSSAIEEDPGVAYVGPPQKSSDGERALIAAVFNTDPDAPTTRNAVDRLRDTLPSVAGERASIGIGGPTASIRDFDRLVSTSLWQLILVVLAFSFVVLVVLLRSIVLPIKATIMNILTIAAAYGVLVAIFQWGWLEWLGVDKTGSLYPTQPFVLVVAFGLSMDYHVFLLSRIRERYAVNRDNKRSVTEALATSALPITSAALIMVAVFAAFVSSGAPSVQQVGLAAAVAIALDATIVRLVIVPAAMELLGDWNWWLPKPLARILPNAELRAPDVEPSSPEPQPAVPDERPKSIVP